MERGGPPREGAGRLACWKRLPSDGVRLEPLGARLARNDHGAGSLGRDFVAHAAEQKAPAEQKQLPLVLVVDDDELITRLLCTIFNANGYRTLAIHDGEEALAMAARHQPALIALDLFMPGLSGFEVLPRLKQNEKTRGIPVICLSAVDDPSRALALGADKFVSKPVDARTLVEIAGALLNRKPSQSPAS